ncbi:hypothetical protein MSAN_02423100 [Mycena sanguinolenta]|uniref:Uncharacterized protein n=1 Tax=Mycena sanguinolenta TaxID=230812 RepID=A0A8H6X2Y6_9AGAR|nr:hypothetical protein MSAN_02423100 [Mycena sanguinolenta]
MPIRRVPISALLLLVAFFVGLSTAQTSGTSTSHVSAPSTSPNTGGRLHISPKVRAVIGVCIAVGVVLIVVASYLCCCHAACRAARARSMTGNLDPENQDQPQEQDIGVQTSRTSIVKDNIDKDEVARTIMDAPPRYDEIR